MSPLNNKINRYPGNKIEGGAYRIFLSVLSDSIHSEINIMYFLLISVSTSTASYWHLGNSLYVRIIWRNNYKGKLDSEILCTNKSRKKVNTITISPKAQFAYEISMSFKLKVIQDQMCDLPQPSVSAPAFFPFLFPGYSLCNSGWARPLT